MQFHTTLRNMRVDQISIFVGPGARVRVYTAGYALLLAECVGSLIAFANAGVGGVLTVNQIADGVAVADGDAALARVYQADGSTLAMTGITVSDTSGSGQLQLDQVGVAVVTGQIVVVDTLRLQEGNA